MDWNGPVNPAIHRNALQTTKCYNKYNVQVDKRVGDPMDKKKTTDNINLAWEFRVLCSDESCIGVIGPDKRCRECGRLYEGELPPNFKESAMKEDDKEDREDLPFEDAGVEGLEEDDDADADDPMADDEWANRILCSDESCIGVIGPDGRCKDCGKVHED